MHETLQTADTRQAPADEPSAAVPEKLSREEAIALVKNSPNDREVVKRATHAHPHAFEHASDQLKSDVEFIKDLIKSNRFSSMEELKYVSEDLKKDKSFATEMVRVGPFALGYFPSLQNDPDINRAAITNNPFTFTRYSGNEIHKNQELALLAISNDESQWMSVDSSLRENRAFLIQAIKTNGAVLGVIKENTPERFAQLCKDNDFLKKVMPYINAHSLPKEVFADAEIADIACRVDGTTLQLIPEKMRSRERCLLAVRENGAAIRYAGEFQKEPSMQLVAVASNRNAIREFPIESFKDAKHVANLILTNLHAEPLIRAIYRENREILGQRPDSVMKARDNMREAFKLLEFDRDFYRFDNSREVIRNRYATEAVYIREPLEEALGKEYFAGIPQDNRPIAFVSYPRRDDNGGFGSENPSAENKITTDHQGYAHVRDSIDTLTRAYRVVYSEAHVPIQISNMLERFKEGEVELTVIGGHGSPTKIQLGVAELTFESRKKLESAGKAIKPGSPVIIDSCSTGNDTIATSGIDNIKELFSSMWSQAEIHAPTRPTNGSLVVDENGLFVRPGWRKRSRSSPTEPKAKQD